jgi:hypothetical protein
VRTFSSAKELVILEHDSLVDDVIEARECLKAWWDCNSDVAGFSTKPAVSGVRREMLVFYSRLDLLSLFPPLNQSEDAIWPNAKSPTGSAYVVHRS